jgi:hypothetical protein
MQECFIRRTPSNINFKQALELEGCSSDKACSRTTSNRPWGKMLNRDKSRRAKVKKDTGLNQHWTIIVLKARRV